MKAIDKKEILICLGAGISQLSLIKVAKKEGHLIIGIDRNSKASGVKYLDEFIKISTYKTKNIISKLMSFQNRYKFSGLIARTSGPALKTAGSIAETFNLNGLTHDIIPLAIEKSSLRNFCCQNNLPVAKGIKVKSYKSFNNEFVMPIIIKPDIPLVGKKDVQVLQNLSSVRLAIKNACQSSGNGYAEIEEYVDGFDVACLFWLKKGRVKILTYWDELVGVENNGIIKGLGSSVPSVIIGTKVEKKVEALIFKLGSFFPSVNGLIILSLRVNIDGLPCIIELHADLGGDLIAEKLFRYADKNFNYFKKVILITCGKKVCLSSLVPKFRPTSMLYRSRKKITLYSSNNLKLNLKKTFSIIKKDKLKIIPKHYKWYKLLK